MPSKKPTTISSDERAQLDKFKAAARELGADKSAKRWDERLAKIAKAKPAPEKPKRA